MPKIGFAGFDSWKSFFLFFNYLAPSIKMIPGFHKKNKINKIKIPLKKMFVGFKNV